MNTQPAVRYLVYADDGAELFYSGEDAEAYQAARSRLSTEYAGALVGQSMMGRERWVLVCYFRAEPEAGYVKRRREGGLLGLAWEAVG